MPRLVALVVALLPSAACAADAPSFLRDVLPVLTRQGCNTGGCHGKGAGQNGFKLSLRGYAPELDHRWLTRDQDGRRADPADPANSLLLRKATGRVPHDGGAVFGVESREYDTLLRWLAAGAPGPDPTEPGITKLDVTPGDRVFQPGESAALVATATFADGAKRDVTWLTKFDTNDAAVAAVTPAGVVTAGRPGATAVRASYLTEVAVCTVAVPFDRAVPAARFEVPDHVFDRPVFAKLKALNIEPAAVCTDEEFVRRAFLDACGILPTVEEVGRFVADPAADKRARLVDHLLARQEFTDYWTLFFDDLFQNRKERDHDVRGAKGVQQFHDWLRDQVARNRPWDELAREVLTAAGKSTEAPAVGYFVVTVGEHREPEKSEVAESAAQAVLGTRIGCARCHNHPLERYTQDDFYHFAAFFSRVKLDRKEPKQGPTTLRVAGRGGRDKEPVGVTQPRTGAFLPPQPLDRSAAPVRPGDDPRAVLAGWATGPGSDLFAGAMVNRVWRHFLGVGLVEPVDDLRATNPPSNPALWAALVGEFKRSGYDLRHLARAVMTSRTYQLSSATSPGNAADGRFYSHYYARRLPAEVLLDAITAVTGVPEKFDGHPAGTRAVQVPDPGVNSYFLSLFGRSERVTACACERGGDVTMPQLLHLQNGDRLLTKLTDTNGWLAKRLAAVPDDAALTDELFRRALGRGPTAADRAAVAAALQSGDPRAEVFRDVLWAVLNSKEFAFNR
ncbi:MAG: DUF1549 domain-containing protein [Gemmataceae bacterium]